MIYSVLFRISKIGRAAILSSTVVLDGCQKIECENNIKGEYKSPNGKCKVVIFSRDCGATTNFNTQISLLSDTKSLPDKPGNLFVSDDSKISISWINDQSLLVEFSPGVYVSKKITEYNGISIKYISDVEK